MRQAKQPVYYLGLIGYPLDHSLSPRLHHAALAAAGLAGEYRLYPITPNEAGAAEMMALTSRLCTQKLHGLNVTIPHKQAVRRLVDAHTSVAQAVGAINTLYCAPDGRLIGDNTDVPGFLRDIDRLLGTQKPGRALILGAGGSARAVVYGLARSGWKLRILSRRAAQAAALVCELGPVLSDRSVLTASLLSASEVASSHDCDLLVNTTPSGMYPHVEACPWPEDIELPPDAAVYDLVYNPLETVLVRKARAAGLPAANGAGMLVAQAALAFQRWTGIDAPFDVMEKAFYDPQTAKTGGE